MSRVADERELVEVNFKPWRGDYGDGQLQLIIAEQSKLLILASTCRVEVVAVGVSISRCALRLGAE